MLVHWPGRFVSGGNKMLCPPGTFHTMRLLGPVVKGARLLARAELSPACAVRPLKKRRKTLPGPHLPPGGMRKAAAPASGPAVKAFIGPCRNADRGSIANKILGGYCLARPYLLPKIG